VVEFFLGKGMKLLSMFKTPQYRSFSFKPRYYDAEKEAFEQRVLSIEHELGGVDSDAEASKARIRKHFSNKRNAKTVYSSRKSNVRILIIIAILSAITFLLLK
jgi:hypothetical protein